MQTKLAELSKEYLKWIIAGYQGCGYIADKNREELHEKLAKELGKTPEELNLILHNLDKWIDFPLTYMEWEREQTTKEGYKVLGVLTYYAIDLATVLMSDPQSFQMPKEKGRWD